jgi:ribosome maturation factor RimP
MGGREAVEREVELRLAADLPDVDLLEAAVVGSGPSAVLRVVVDHPAGVDHALCVEVTRALERAGLRDRYGVEVSSPGPERPLRTLAHLEAAVGERVRVSVEGRPRPVLGTLVAADDDTLTVELADAPVELPRRAVRRVRRAPAASPQPIARSRT